MLKYNNYDTIIKYAWGPNPREGSKSASKCLPRRFRFAGGYGPGIHFLVWWGSKSAGTPVGTKYAMFNLADGCVASDLSWYIGIVCAGF